MSENGNVPSPLDRAIEEYRSSQVPAAESPTPPANDHGEQFETFYRPEWRNEQLQLDVSTSPAAGFRLVTDMRLPFPIRSLRCDNLSGYRLRVNGGELFIPPGKLGFSGSLPSMPNMLRVDVDAAGEVGEIRLTLYERDIGASGGIDAGAGGSGGPFGAETALISNVQGGPGPSAAHVLVANQGRSGALLKNLDAAITVWLFKTNAGVVGAGNGGFPLAPGESLPVTARDHWWFLAESGQPWVAVIEEQN